MDKKFAKALEVLKELSQKHEDYPNYLEGLKYSRGVQYWNYINLNSLLGLQNPITDFKDETIFITFHQICELYFKLIKHEITSLVSTEERNKIESWKNRIGRCVNYFDLLCHSFSVMHSGMNRSEFMKFRLSLLPASGFQSIQFREIEIYTTNLSNLIPYELRKKNEEAPVEQIYNDIYWKFGGLIHGTDQKTDTLKEFESKYDGHLINLIKQKQFTNLNYLYSFLPEGKEELTELLKRFDEMVNINWKFGHLKAIQQQLLNNNDIKARTKDKSISKGNTGTGGTDFEKYLLPLNQKIRFFPSLWTDEEISNWGSGIIENKFAEKYISAYMSKHVEDRMKEE